MQVKDQQLKLFLLDFELLSKEEIEIALREAKKSNKKLEEILIEKKIISEEEINNLKAYILGIPFVSLKENDIDIDIDILKIIPEQVARQYSAIAFDKQGEQLKVAMLNPSDLQFIDFISKKTGLKIVPCLTNKEGIKVGLKAFQKSLKAEFGDIAREVGMENFEGDQEDLTIKTEIGGIKDKLDLQKAAEDLPVVKIVDTFIKHAILQGASDIHIEPEEKDVIIRYRVDGILHSAMTLPKVILPGIVARIKVLSNLKIDEHRLPQDGRFKVETADYKVAFRVSIIPVFDGEKIVMRLLDESTSALTLKQIGFRKRDLEIINKEIQKPDGMVLVVGPTGSGKTTTLYTVLAILNVPEVNISTLEDPVEYRMKKVNQTQVNAKINFTFASGLRALLRQDPDIIMVGEIRDRETAELAVHAALTGHLVLSTLHTNSAAGTLPRLADMGIEPFLVASTANIILSQRLVRKICSECPEKYTLDESAYESIARNFDTDAMAELLQKEEIVKGKYANNKEMWLSIKFTRGKGCAKCREEGYKGRVGIFEALSISEKISKLINSKADSDEIEQEAIKEGMTTMLEDGIIKAVQGITTLEEIMRVTKE